MRHVIFMNTKGGVGKSTLCEYSANELKRLGYKVSVYNTDQQQHVTSVDIDQPDFCLYDTAGAFTEDNVQLLEAAVNAETQLIIPMQTGKNDAKELPFLVETLNHYGYQNKCTIVYTKTRANSKALTERRGMLSDLGLGAAKWVMPALEDFGEQRNTARTRNEISAFLHEVIL